MISAMAADDKVLDVTKQVLSSGDISTDKLFEQFVPTSVDMFLTVIDQCRYFIEHSPSIANPAGQRYRGLISAKDRKELDQTLDQYYDDVTRREEREIARMGLTEEEIKSTLESHHPVPLEAAIVASNAIFRKVHEEARREHFSKYADEPAKLEYILTKARLGRAGTIEAVLGDALVPLIVSKMEEFLVSLVRTGIMLYPKSLGELPNIPNEVFQRYQSDFSHTDITLWQIEQKADAFIDGPPSEWHNTLLRWTKIDISQLGAEWDMITEMIQRRHAIIHNGGRVDAEYMRKVSENLKYGLRPGSRLLSGKNYMLPVLAELETWAVCLALRWGKHFFKESTAYYPFTLDRVVSLEEAGRWTQALAILDTILLKPLPPNLDDVAIAKINRWFCLQELGRENDALRREISDIGTGEEYTELGKHATELGKHALLREYDALAKVLLRFTERSGAIEKRMFREMPLLQRAMRESPKIRAILLRAGPSPQRTSTGKAYKKRAR